MKRTAIALLTVAPLLTIIPLRAEQPSEWRFALSPLAGTDRNELRRPTGRTGTIALSDSGPMYGLFALAVHPNWALSNFFFLADVNQTDVLGNLFFANHYTNPDQPLGWNVGAGHLYHEIRTARGDITVQVPMVKTGPVFRAPALRLTINPYIGHAWERTDVPRVAATEEVAHLFGVTLNWRWRMWEAGVNYYYQQSRETREGSHVARARLIGMFNRRWGLCARVDYAEHRTTDDFSVLAGPIVLF